MIRSCNVPVTVRLAKKHVFICTHKDLIVFLVVTTKTKVLKIKLKKYLINFLDFFERYETKVVLIESTYSFISRILHNKFTKQMVGSIELEPVVFSAAAPALKKAAPAR